MKESSKIRRFGKLAKGGRMRTALWKSLCLVVMILHLLTTKTFAKGVCIEKPVEPCLTVHGRLSIYNGNPPLRIWKIGTKRILGISNGDDPEAPVVPQEIEKVLTAETAIYADFVVCPYSKDEPGVMQYVCIDSVTNVVVRKLW